MIVHLDTSFLVDAFTGARRSLAILKEWWNDRAVIRLSSPVIFEWLRGPRSDEELLDQEHFFPLTAVERVEGSTASRAADLYRNLKSPRGREMDILIAACALEQGAALATLNREDFEDIPDLILIPERRS